MNFLSSLVVAGVSAVALASAAHASDLIVADAPISVGYADATGQFDGGFVGVFGGGAMSDLDFPTLGGLGGVPFAISPEGWLVGVDAGFNFALDNGLVLGVVGDIAYADLTDDLGAIGTSIGSTIDWQGSLRARAGFDAGNFMPYVTAGLAVAHNNMELGGVTGGGDPPLPPVPFTAEDDNIHVGWTVGAGVEFAVAENLSIDANYRYSDYGSETYEVPFGTGGDDVPTGGEFGLTSHQLTVGLHYGF